MKVVRQTTSSGSRKSTTILDNFDQEVNSISYSEKLGMFEIQTVDDKGREHIVQISILEFAGMFGHLSPSLIKSGLANSEVTGSTYKMLRKYAKINNGE